MAKNEIINKQGVPFIQNSRVYSSQIPYTGKIWLGQNALGQPDCRIFELIISLEQNDEIAWFFNVDSSSWKLTVDWKIFG